MKQIISIFIFFLISNVYGVGIKVFENPKTFIYYIEVTPKKFILLGYGGDNTGKAGVCGFLSEISNINGDNYSIYFNPEEYTDRINIKEYPKYQFSSLLKDDILKIDNMLLEDCPLQSDFNGKYKNINQDNINFKARLKLIINLLANDSFIKNILIEQYSKTLNFYLLINSKTQLYKTPSEESITKMYLIAGDKADLLEEKIDEKSVKWYNILYHGKKDINAWIKADESINIDSENK